LENRYDRLIGGKDHYAADREAGQRLGRPRLRAAAPPVFYGGAARIPTR
jgi:hypothetical protein